MIHLRRVRLDRDITQVELAAMLGYGQPAVSTWERGLAVPRKAAQAKLEKIFGVPAAVLLTPENDNGGAPKDAAEKNNNLPTVKRKVS